MGSVSGAGERIGRRPPPPGFPPEAAEQGLWPWFVDFLASELRPYPGRASVVTRMVIAASLTAVLIMTFRIPGAALAAYYTLILARESPRATLGGAVTVMAAYLAAGVYCLVGIWLFVDYPLPHFLWVVVSLFLCFFLIKVMTSGVASAAFAFSVTIVLPLWDTPLPEGVLLTGTLWAIGGVAVGLVVTLAVEYVFSALVSTDELLSGISERLAAVAEWMRACSGGDGCEEAGRRVAQLAVVGVSRLRRLTGRPGEDIRAARSGTTVSLVGRLVDIAAAASVRSGEVSEPDRDRLQRLAAELDRLRRRLGKEFRLRPRRLHLAESGIEDRDPLIVDLETTTQLLAQSLGETGYRPSEAEPSSAGPRTGLFVPDAFSNPEHVHYALRGCLAATLCYILINAVAWRGINTALATCVITALSSVGSSRQKQVLRLAGAVVGGVVFGIGSQVLILPALDSIGGFLLLFAAVTAVAAWFATSSPRLSYFGLQIALAFYLIHLQEFAPQINLTIGRDRVIGILLGLLMMWVVFERLGSSPAIQVMQETFAGNLLLLAELVELGGQGAPAAARVRGLRERISANFATVNAQADAVLFETGAARAEHLRIREHLLAVQPEIRSAFLMVGGLLQYRLQVDPSTLAAPVRAAQAQFDHAVARELRGLSRPTEQTDMPSGRLRETHLRLENAVAECGAQVKARAEGILALNASLVSVLEDLQDREREFARGG